jgi:hypothetical protein
MIRQVTDGRGSFVKSSKEFVEFRDLAVWCSFSLSTFGYPRVPSRLMRHFHMVRLHSHQFASFISLAHVHDDSDLATRSERPSVCTSCPHVHVVLPEALRRSIWRLNQRHPSSRSIPYSNVQASTKAVEAIHRLAPPDL